MGFLQAKLDPTAAKNIMYMCAAAPFVAFGARMIKSAMQYVDPICKRRRSARRH
jgi:hypothetical protein